MVGCKTKNIISVGGDAPPRSKQEILQALTKNTKSFEYYDAKISADVETEEFGIGVGVTLRMKKDEYIWCNYKKLGIEAARSYITKDSIFIVNRLQRYYQAEPLQSVWELVSYPLSIGEMQDLIVGNLVIPEEKDILSFEKKDDAYRMAAVYKGNNYYYLIDGSTMLVTKVILEDRGELLEVLYEDFIKVDGVKRPTSISINVNTKDLKAQLKLKVNETEWEKYKDASFSIPTRYERVGF
jgi:hypothetical protein